MRRLVLCLFIFLFYITGCVPTFTPTPIGTQTPAPIPNPAPVIKPTPTPAYTYLDHLAKEIMTQVNADRTVKLVSNNMLEIIAQERAKETDAKDTAELTTDPQKRLVELNVAYDFCIYGQSQIKGGTLETVKIATLIEGFRDRLMDESYTDLGIALYAAPKGITMAIVMTGRYTYSPEFLLQVEQEILILVNGERQQAGLGALKWHHDAHRVARGKVLDMYTKDYFAHVTEETGSLAQQFETLGGLILGKNISALGENLAYTKGYIKYRLTAEYYVQQWMDSKGHRANILNGSFTHMGAGVYYGEDGRAYAAQAFCTPQ